MDRSSGSHPRGVYRKAAERYGRERAGVEGDVRRVEAARMATFLIGALAGLLREELPVPQAISIGVAVVSFAAFIVLVVRHRRLQRRLSRVRAAQALARAGLHRLDRAWSDLRSVYEEVTYRDHLLDPATRIDESHPYHRDLDLVGPASVRALLGPTPSPVGAETLEGWLSAPAPPDEIARRHGAVRALASDHEGRERLAIESLLVDPIDRHAFLAFRAWIDGRAGALLDVLPRWAIHVARFLPPLTLALVAAWVFGLLPSIAWAVPLGLQVALAWRWGQRMAPMLDAAGAGRAGLKGHGALFAAWESCDLDEPEIERVLGRLTGDSGALASAEIRRLERWLDAADSRSSMLHFAVAGGLLWDVHVAWGLERWRRRAGPAVSGWFDALGRLEALSALATVAFDHPTWCYPEFTEGTPTFRAEGLGHPLLSERELATSDVGLDPPGRFLLVTGSNMSGKSTLLRSIALGSVLAQAGSVVCATRLTLTPLRTFTSMRIHDSLTDGVSLFMAELLRLKALVDAADEATPGGPALLYLVDEVLQGTNSEERRIAARHIVRHLLHAHAIGAVTTHDLALHEDPDLDSTSTKVHFREQVHEDDPDVLTFDYRLRPGLATSRNALKLLRIVGLDDTDDGP